MDRWDLNVCSKLVEENYESFTKYLSQLENSDLEKLVIYKNSKAYRV